MGAGLIYALIVVIWAVVLTPTWIRRSDGRLDPLFAARSSPQMRVLERRTSAHGARSVGLRPSMPPITRRPLRYGLGGTAVRMPVTRPFLRTSGRADQRPPAAAQRDHASDRTASAPRPAKGSGVVSRRPDLAARRRLVVTMLIAAVGLGAAVPLSGVPLWAPLVPVAAFIGYMRYVRGEARRAYERRRRERTIARRQAEARRRAELQVAQMTPLPGRERPTMRIQPDGTWEPIKVPVPTYVTAPVARGHRGRPIAVGLAGAWTGRRMSDLMRQSQRMPGRSLVIDETPAAASEPAQPRAANE